MVNLIVNNNQKDLWLFLASNLFAICNLYNHNATNFDSWC